MTAQTIIRIKLTLSALWLLAVFIFTLAPASLVWAAGEDGSVGDDTTTYDGFQTPSINLPPGSSTDQQPYDSGTGDGIGAPPAGLDCDPLPEDMDELNECLYWLQFYPIAPKVEYGQPSNPIALNAMGTRGMAGAYDSASNTYLIVAQDFSGGVVNGKIAGNSQIVGIIVNAETNAVVKDKFVINQGGGDQGAPLVVYNPDKDEYLVAWEDSRTNGGNRRFNYARVVKGDGSMPESDFALVNDRDAFLQDLDYDPLNQRYVITSQPSPGDHPYIQVINADGSRAVVDLGPRPNSYEGQVSLAVNTDTDTYDITYVLGLDIPPPRPGARGEDNRIMFMRADASTLTATPAEPILLSTPIPGELGVGSPSIAYDAAGHQTVVVWGQYNVLGVRGRTVGNDGTLGPIVDVLTPQSDPSSDQFGTPKLNYNPWTESLYMSTLDNNGGTMLVKMLGTTVVQTTQPIAPSDEKGFNGQFNPTSFTTPTGAIAMSSTNYGSVKMGTIMNPKVFPEPAAAAPGEPPKIDVTDPAAIGKLVSQIYLWSLGIGGVLALLMIVLGGYRTMTAAGNAARATEGKEYIYSSLIGLGILFASYLILSTINPDLARFDLSSLTGLAGR